MGIQLRIIIGFLALVYTSATLFASYYLYKKVFIVDKKLASEVAEIQKNASVAKPDPGKNKYAQAIETLRTGSIHHAREQLYEILGHYRDSERFQDAKRIIGEINADQLLSDTPGPGKKEYTVQRGDSLNLIATKQKVSIESIFRCNSMMGVNLQPGMKLLLPELEFTVVIDVTNKLLVLTYKDRFFKDYPIRDIRLNNVRLPFSTTVNSKNAYLSEKSISVTDPNYSIADKFVQCAKGGAAIRTYKNGVLPSMEESPTGIFLEPEDCEEIFCILRTGTPINFIK